MTQTLQYRTAQAIDDAATLIEEKGWCRNRYRDGDRHCTIGALVDVTLSDDGAAYVAAYEAITTEIRLQPDYRYASIPGWNDVQRDRRKVVRLLRRTARKVRRGEIPVR